MSHRHSNATRLFHTNWAQRLLDRFVSRVGFDQSPVRFQWARILQAGTIATAATLSIACSDDETITPPDVEDPRKTIAGSMQELGAAYIARDLHRYSALFDSDFVFVFDPTDVQADPDLPENWDLTEELNSAANMFESNLLERITVDFVVGTPVPADSQDVGDTEFPEGTMKVLVTDVDLNVDTRDPAGGENIIYRVVGDQAVFFLYQDSLEIVDGVPVWKIFEWRDKKIGAAPTLEASWGSVKNHYR